MFTLFWLLSAGQHFFLTPWFSTITAGAKKPHRTSKLQVSTGKLVKYLPTQVGELCMQVVLNPVWFRCEWDGIPVCQRLVRLLCSGSVSQRRSRCCRAVPGEWAGSELNWSISGKHPRRPRRKSRELCESVQSPRFSTHDSAVNKHKCCVQRNFTTHRHVREFLHLV